MFNDVITGIIILYKLGIMLKNLIKDTLKTLSVMAGCLKKFEIMGHYYYMIGKFSVIISKGVLYVHLTLLIFL